MPSERKAHSKMSEEKFQIIKTQRNTTPLKNIATNLNLSYSCVVKVVKNIEDSENPEQYSFTDLQKKQGRKKKDKSQVYNTIRLGFGEDNSLTLRGIKEKKNLEYSIGYISKLKKEAGLSRKRLKKKSNVLLTNSSRQRRREFCAEISGLRNKQILFLDECGFNLHESINYGYSAVGEDAIAYLNKSRGKNNSVCALISIAGVQHHRRISGAYNTEEFIQFLRECTDKGIFSNEVVLVYDNVAFHRSEQVKNYLRSLGVQIMHLPAYSPDLNPIENFFSVVKSKFNSIRPRATTELMLQRNIETSFYLAQQDLSNFYRGFWSRVSQIINNIDEENN